jgi:SHS2 domain-containing protein
LEEVLYEQDARDRVITSVAVNDVDEGRAVGTITVLPRGDRELEGTAVKAVTYHQLSVERDAEGWTARVFFDI